MSALAASNHRIRRLRRLSGRRGAREDEGVFVLEGPVWVREAVARGAGVEGIYVDDAADDASAHGADLIVAIVALAAERGVPVHRVEAGVLAGVSDVVTPRPVLAVVEIPRHTVADLAAGARASGRPLVVLVEVRDPGNVGTIVRAADGAGAAGVVCSVGTADPWAPKVVRSSTGSVLHVPVVSGVSLDAVVEVLADAGVPLVVTSSHDGTPYDEFPLGAAHALVFGNEARGVSGDIATAASGRVAIPLDGRAESLNVAMAASVLLFEAQRQRRLDSDWTPMAPDDKVNTS